MEGEQSKTELFEIAARSVQHAIDSETTHAIFAQLRAQHCADEAMRHLMTVLELSACLKQIEIAAAAGLHHAGTSQ